MSASAGDTIAAVATAPGRGGIGVLRLSGPAAAAIARQLSAADLPPPRQAALRDFNDADGSRLDRGLLLWFPAPASYTGEDVVELHAHGGPVLLQALTLAACRAGARPARPGEFSERAYLNGKLDLAQAEAVADLIDAASLDAVRAARRSLDGALSQRIDGLVEAIVALRVRVEGALDFSDEDVDWLADGSLARRAAALCDAHRALLAQAARGRRLREGMRVAIAGQPNVGKSTLLNRLVGADAAIVTDQPGTTRDVLREALLMDGLPLTLIDTAGLRESEDVAEREGVRRAWQALADADVILFMSDDRDATLSAADAALLARLPVGPQRLHLRNKCDLSGRPPQRAEERGETTLRLSAAADLGLDLLRQTLRERAGLGTHDEGLFSARTRHLDALRRADAHLQRVAAISDGHLPMELVAEELRLAQAALGEITGAVSSEALLGRIFAEFCIGK